MMSFTLNRRSTRETTGPRIETREMRRGARLGLGLVVALGVLVRCDCEETTFMPGATYMPAKNLPFGAVSVTTEKRLDVKVISTGGASLKLLAANLENASSPGKWLVEVAEPLLKGLSPGRTSSISVTYRPCPDAWETVTVIDPSTNMPRAVDRIQAGFDFSRCPLGASDAAELVTVEDGTRSGGARIGLSGEAVLPPSVSLGCQRAPSVCNMPEAAIPSDACVGMVFGQVSAGGAPCDLEVEVRNSTRDGRRVGDLVVERIEISVQNIDEDPAITRRGADVGFILLDAKGDPLVVDPGHPLVVPVPLGEVRGAQRFRIRFTGAASGVFDGRAMRGMTGVKLYTSDPDKPSVGFSISGTGSAPDIAVTPPALSFGPVNQGTMKALTATIANIGDADLAISGIRFETDTSGTRFRFTTSRGTAFPVTLAPSARMGVTVTYAPRASGQDLDALIVGNNDPKTMGLVRIPISGGAVPKLRVDPPESLVFPSGQGDRREQVVLSNVGFGDLRVKKLRISGPGDDMNHPSVDDFAFMDCTNPCEPNILLCAPSSPGCTNPRTAVNIVYQNNDVSTVDVAELHITSDDPASPEQSVFLEARDTPCLHPTPVIRVETPAPCKGRPIRITGADSQPGGPVGGGAGTLTRFDWQWAFASSSPPPLAPNGTASPVLDVVPTEAGFFVLNLMVSNDCGASSQTPASQTITVAETCN